MKKLPLGIQNFKKIVTGGYIYIDKTQYAYELINDANYYFLSRPRRFGKSLFLDTIGEIFIGDKELFKGLWIYDSDYEFDKHPILRFDMSNISNRTSEILESSLMDELQKHAVKEGFIFSCVTSADLFKNLIEAMYEKYNRGVIVLIDEYDKPILDRLNNIKTAEANRDVLRGFYGVLKSMDPYLRLTFITGITKFTKTSVFSGLNNLLDITMMEKYSNICGVEIDDLERVFGNHINELATLDWFVEFDNLHDEILAWYDGYSWDGKSRVINPFSLLSFFVHRKFGNFWYVSGTPTFLMKLIKKDPCVYTNMTSLRITELMLDTAELDEIDAALLLFQTGYLTVKERISKKGVAFYLLDTPNYEVRDAFNLHILTAFTENKQSIVKNAQITIDEALQQGDLGKVQIVFKRLFASIPYQLHIGQEAYYHSIFYAVLNLLGFQIDAEVSVSGGIVDATLELMDKVYVIEFKYKDCKPDIVLEAKQKLFESVLEEGMIQIKNNGYYKKYTGSGKTVYLAAFAFLGRDDIEMQMETLID